MTLNGVTAVILRYLAKIGSCALVANFVVVKVAEAGSILFVREMWAKGSSFRQHLKYGDILRGH